MLYAHVNYKQYAYTLMEHSDGGYSVINQSNNRNIVLKTYKYKKSALKLFDRFVEELELKFEHSSDDSTAPYVFYKN